MLAAIKRLLSLRVVRGLPSTAVLSVYARTQRAGVLQASVEETAGRCHALMEGDSAMGISVVTFR
jgi:hypothetical protein